MSGVGLTMATGTGEGKAGHGGPRRGGGFRRAGTASRAPLDAAASRHGFAVSDVLLRWQEVVGEELAELCHPLRVSYGRGRSLGATLVVEVEGARGPEVDMRAPRIVERVNSFYGYRAISRLSVTQTSAGSCGFAEDQAAFAGPAAPPAGPRRADLRRAAELAAEVENPALRDALTRMGAYVLSQNREPGAR